jgi:2,4-dienoyl-CoA reductase (NADPH2)
MLAGVQYERIDDAGLHITVGGEARLLAMGNMIICAGQDSLDELRPVAETVGGPQFHKIDGAKLDAKRAIREGAVLGAGL